MMDFARLALLTVLPTFFLQANAVPAADDARFSPAMRRVQSDQGLPSNAVYAIAQDRQGYIWFGTERGLVRLDGKEVVPLGLPDAGLRAAVPRLAVETLAIDSRNQLWMAFSEGGVCVLDETRHKSTCFNEKTANKARQLLSNSVFAMIEFNGSMWLSEYEHGLVEIDLSTLAITRREALADAVVVAGASESKQGYFLSLSGDLHRLSLDSSKRTVLSQRVAQAPAPASALLLDGKALWIGGHQNQQLTLFDAHTLVSKTYHLPGIRRMQALARHADALVVSTERGLLLFDPSNAQTRAIRAVSGAKQGLPEGMIFSLLSDREGALWIGSTTDGAAYWAPGDSALSWLFRGEGGLPSAQVQAVSQADDGVLWIGLYDRGLLAMYPDGTQERMLVANNRPDALPHDMVRAVYATGGPNQRVWIGHQLGLSVYDPARRRYQHLATNGARQIVDLIYPSDQGHMWIVSQRSVVMELDANLKVIQTLDAEATGGEIEQISQMEDMLWLASSEGLQVFNRALELQAHPQKESIYAFTSCETPNNMHRTVWTVSAQHITQLDAKTYERLQRFDRPGEYAQDIGGLVCESGTKLLLAGPGGAWRMSTLDGRSESLFDESDRPEFSSYPFYQLDQAALIGANRGLLRVAEEKSWVPERLSKSLELILSDGYHDLSRQLTLPAAGASARVQARALSFVQPELTRYRFLLEPGASTEFSEQSDFNLGLLAPGDYQLQAHARLYSGEILQSKKIAIRIPTPLSQQRWFVVLISLLTLFACFAFAYGISRQRAKKLATRDRLRRESAFELELAKARTEALARISHEMRNLLNGVTGNTELLRQSSSRDQQVKFSARIAEAGEGLANLLDDALDHTKLKLNQLKLQFAPFELDEFFDDLLQIAKQQCEQAGLTLLFERAPMAFAVTGDRARIRQIIVNLLSNAVKFSTRGTITLRTEYDGTQLKLEVLDQGPGIPEYAQQKIFEPYTRLPGHTRGTGLGLSISAELARAHGGHLMLKHSSELGSCFALNLPLQMASDTAPEQTVTLATLDILLIEDELANQDLAVDLLQSAGHRVFVATDAFSLLTLLPQLQKVDVVLLDLDLQSSSGFDLMPLICAQALLGNVPVIALSGRAERADVDQCLAAGMIGHIAKPYRLKLIQQKLKDLLNL
jgi:signal transduction histidine kinase/ligand-binding sensor domain-containing protein/CheY-like chemotaxis protein